MRRDENMITRATAYPAPSETRLWREIRWGSWQGERVASARFSHVNRLCLPLRLVCDSSLILVQKNVFLELPEKIRRRESRLPRCSSGSWIDVAMCLSPRIVGFVSTILQIGSLLCIAKAYFHLLNCLFYESSNVLIFPSLPYEATVKSSNIKSNVGRSNILFKRSIL